MRGRFSYLRRVFGRASGSNTPCSDCEPVNTPPRIAGGEETRSEAQSRREFLARFGVGLAGLAAILAGIPLVGAFLSTPERRERIWHAVGEVDDFPIDETVKVEFTDPDALPWAGPAARSAAWLRRIGDEDFTAFSVYCTHTGCPVSWRAGANLFICPCHGGVFDREGAVIGGPPEEPLVRLDVRIREQQVEVLAAPIPVTGELP
jgi:menaquinol-cytochrome c reductase iron-sulfur subunit